MHLDNIFASGELETEATIKEFLIVRTEGKRKVRRRLKHYNLDASISLGYRVNTKLGVRILLNPAQPSGAQFHPEQAPILAEHSLQEARETRKIFSSSTNYIAANFSNNIATASAPGSLWPERLSADT